MTKRKTETVTGDHGTLTMTVGDCVHSMSRLNAETFDVVVTSPPYNLNIDYSNYKDKMGLDDYLAWTFGWMEQVSRVLKPDGSFFLNISGSPSQPWVGFDVASVARESFELQNHIAWVKSISIGDETHGHFKPINSKRYLNDTHEFIFHFTKTNRVSLDRLAVGVPFQDKSNIRRRGHAADKRCAGNTWYIPYKTAQSKKDKFNHPASFPVELPERCILLHGVENTHNVLDPFGGIGSTAMACGRHNINCTLMEMDRGYASLAVERYQGLGG
jgi:site-specific DNA-methyltransferase (adenine-specific)